jgi:hypothetical protein
MSLPREPRQKMINMMYLVLTACGTECIIRDFEMPLKPVNNV